jgi:hypothetical protein
MTQSRSLPVVRAAAFDAIAILAFVAIGRRSHAETGSVIGGIASVSTPFLIGLAVGWAVARAWRHPAEPATGIVIWLVTVAAGMVLRHWAFDRGTAVPFIIVATLFTGLLLVGWRLAWERWASTAVTAS